MTNLRPHLESALASLSAALALLDEQESPRKLLPVPYLSQWGAGADQRRGDCGPACVAMLVRYVTGFSEGLAPTVDEVAAACGQPIPSSATTFADLQRGAAAYGVKLDIRGPFRPPALTPEIFKAAIDLGKPSIALINYGVLRDLTDKELNVVLNQDINYVKGHWVVFIGYDADGVVVHDSNFWPPRTQDGCARWIPAAAFEAALRIPAPGNRYGNAGLVLV